MAEEEFLSDSAIQSRRAIDLYTASHLGRMDERLKAMERIVEALAEEVQGGKGQPGLGEQVRSVMKIYGIIIGIITMVVSWAPWIYDHFTVSPIKAEMKASKITHD